MVVPLYVMYECLRYSLASHLWMEDSNKNIFLQDNPSCAQAEGHHEFRLFLIGFAMMQVFPMSSLRESNLLSCEEIFILRWRKSMRIISTYLVLRTMSLFTGHFPEFCVGYLRTKPYISVKAHRFSTATLIFRAAAYRKFWILEDKSINIFECLLISMKIHCRKSQCPGIH